MFDQQRIRPLTTPHSPAPTDGPGFPLATGLPESLPLIAQKALPRVPTSESRSVGLSATRTERLIAQRFADENLAIYLSYQVPISDSCRSSTGSRPMALCSSGNLGYFQQKNLQSKILTFTSVIPGSSCIYPIPPRRNLRYRRRINKSLRRRHIFLLI